MVNSETAKTFRDVRDSIIGLASKKEALVRRPEWGEITFEGIETEIHLVFWLAERTKDLPINILPEDTVSRTVSGLTRILRSLHKIDSFRLRSFTDPSSARDEIVGSLQQDVQNVMSEFSIWLPFLALYEGEIENWTGQARATSVEASENLKTAKETAAKDLAEIEAIKQTARMAAGEAGAAEFTEEFHKEAKAVTTRGERWLVATIILGIIYESHKIPLK